jgi:penicillin G amidase
VQGLLQGFKRACGIGLGLSVAGGLGIYWLLRHSLPKTSGVVSVPGFHGIVEIVRDEDAVPHIFAQRKPDAFFGLGYIHAADRLWQLDFQRRAALGRLSEVFGQQTLYQDRFIRTVGFHRAARAAWETTSPETKLIVQAYVAGINAFIAACPWYKLQPEFLILRCRPERWSEADVLATIKMMAWELSGNFDIELLRRDLVAKLGAERAQQILPDYPSDGPSILQSSESASAAHAANPARFTSIGAPDIPASIDVQALLGQRKQSFDSLGSNCWVVDGTKSATGKPILASDPHLGVQAPPLWYLAHLCAEDLDAIGATIPGLPAVVIGRNRSISWGIANLNPDVQDLFRERVDPAGHMAEFQGRLEPMQIIVETIKVKGSASIDHKVRITRHGPLISDALAHDLGPQAENAPSEVPEPLALSWTALAPDDTTITAFLSINTARNWEQFTAALRCCVAPAQSFVYADTEGNIGYYAAGRMPLRAGGDGALPAEGWSGTHEWLGWIAFEDLPHAYNPPEHFIVAANQQPAAHDYPHFLGREWASPYRARRIHEILSAKAQFTPADFAAMQGDTVSLLARDLLPLLLPLLKPQSAQEQRAAELLVAWDHRMASDSPAAALFAAWFRLLPHQIIKDELGQPLFDRYWWRFQFVTRFLTNTLAEQAADSPTADNLGGLADHVVQTFGAAVSELCLRLGPDLQAWRWDRLHQLNIRHRVFDEVRVLRRFFSRSVPSCGDAASINVGPYGYNFEQDAGPAYRQVVDLADLQSGQFIHVLGQSGHVFSPYYDHYLCDWQSLKCRPMRMAQEHIKRGRHDILLLQPWTQGKNL